VWTKPDDLLIDENDPKKGLFGPDATHFLVAWADGTTGVVPKKVDPQTLLYYFLKNDGHVVQRPE
ncbi:MAG: hypothetical protein ACJ8F7_19450, partial [Gemmataceae bacterium]